MNELAEIKRLDLTKKEVEEFAAGACHEIVNGTNDILNVGKNLKAIELIIDTIKTYIKGHMLDEADKHGKSFEYNGAKFEIGYRNTYEFKSDPTWVKLDKQRTDRQNLLKNLKKPVADVDTGEIINPPLHKLFGITQLYKGPPPRLFIIFLFVYLCFLVSL